MALAVHETEIRVRYQETDGQRRLHHANYLTYFEMGRTEMLRACGRTYREFEDAGLVMVKIPVENLPKVMTMSEHAVADFDVRTVVGDAAATLRKEIFPAVAGKGCRYCKLKVCCPLYMPKDSVTGDDEEDADAAE